MNIFEATFYEHNPFYFEDSSIQENEAINSTYLTITNQLIDENIGFDKQAVICFYRGKWYPLIVPSNVNDEGKMRDFAKVLEKNYRSVELRVSNIYNHLIIEKELISAAKYQEDIDKLLSALKNISK